MLAGMSEDANTPHGGPPDPSQPGGSDDLYLGKIRQDQMGIGARVPERVANGSFATGAIVLEGPGEFLIDFVQGIARPARICARIVMVPPVMHSFLQALRDNLQKYEAAFGPPKPVPRPPQDRRPSIKEVYDDLRLGDDVLSGSYATHAMIAHSPADFYFDFITRFYPTASVSARVYMSASQVPRFLESLTVSFGNYQKRMQAHGGPPPGGFPIAPLPPPEPEPPRQPPPADPQDPPPQQG